MCVDYDSLPPFEKDALWLKNKLPGLSQDDIEKFCQKVAILTQEYGVSENRARFTAYGLYFG